MQHLFRIGIISTYAATAAWLARWSWALSPDPWAIATFGGAAFFGIWAFMHFRKLLDETS